jgi:integrase
VKQLDFHGILFSLQQVSGKRVHSRDTLSRFKTSMRKVIQNKNFKKDISYLGLHSLRHMFGHAMAEIYARTGDDSLIKITQDAMGHSNLDSTLVYFNISSETMKEAISKATKDIHRLY